MRLSADCSYLLAAVLAIVTFLSGFSCLVWPSELVVTWKMQQDWSDVLLVLLATLCAAAIGGAIEMLLASCAIAVGAAGPAAHGKPVCPQVNIARMSTARYRYDR